MRDCGLLMDLPEIVWEFFVYNSDIYNLVEMINEL